MNEQILEQVERLAEAYGRTNISDARIEIYAEELDGMPVEHLTAVVKRLLRTHPKFFPTIAEIYDAWTDVLLGPPAPSEALDWCLAKHRELEAAFDAAYFAKPVTQRGERLPYRPKPPTEFPDRVTEEAVRLCDWAELIGIDKEFRKGWWDKKYLQAREHIAKRIQAGEVRLALPQPDELRPALMAVS